MTERVEPSTDTVSLRIAAPPERIWDMVSDITRMGEWSPENRGGRWRDGADGPALGARFFGLNRHRFSWWVTPCRVTECDRPRAFAFQVYRTMRWGYRLEPDGDGTVVTEWRQHVGPSPLVARVVIALGLVGRDRERLMVEGMRTTLERLRAAAEGAGPAETRSEQPPGDG